MESPILNKLADKYWQGECSEQEEQQLKDALLHGPAPSGLESLAEYLSAMQQAQESNVLDANFDTKIMARLSPKKISWPRMPYLMQIAASIVLILGLGVGVQTFVAPEIVPDPILSEFVDTYQDSEIAYQEVKKALMMVSSSMNEGLEPVELLGEFDKVKTEIENQN